MAKRGENIYKRKDGRWEGRYIKDRKGDGTIQYGYIYRHSYKETKEQVILMKSLYYQEYYTLKTKYEGTLEQWCLFWLSNIQKNVKKSTYVSYSNKLSQHIFPMIGQIDLRRLSPPQIESCLKSLEEKLSRSSIHVILQVLKTCLNEAVKKGILIKNPCNQISVPKLPFSSVLSLTVEEEVTLQKYARSHPKGLPIILSLQAGLRIGEICGLKWQDIDFSSNVINVSRTIQRLPALNQGGKKKTMIVEHSPKSVRSLRTIPMSTTIRTELLKIKEQSTSPYVFGKKNPAEPRLITYWFKKIINELKLPNYRFHALRHTFATRCLEKGVTIATISDILGHHSIKMTLDTYINTFLSEKRDAINLIDYN